jgi:predicted SAM-dependent methyltransferase
MKTFLHVGCGNNTKLQAGRGFQGDEWQEIRFDINPAVKPDIIGTMTDMSAVENSSVDALFSSHNIEHLYPHEVPLALAEFKRVLGDDGFVVITCPDLQSVAKLVVEDKLAEPAYQSPAGPITPLDMLYGLRTSMARGNLYMAHRCGFTQRVLAETLKACGFSLALVRRREAEYALWAIAFKSPVQNELIQQMATEHFPA